LFAYIFGVTHSFLPGHGKTIVCGYYIGRRRDIKKILFIAAVTVITHIFSSALLGVLAMTISGVMVKNVLLPKIQIFSAFLLIFIGIAILISSYHKSAKRAGYRHPHIHDGHFHTHEHNIHEASEEEHSHGKLDSLLNQYMMSEKLPFHKNMQLIWLGIASGIVPCVEPFIVMLFAISLNKLVLGFSFLFFFGLGIFTTMVILGLLFSSEKFASDSVAAGPFGRIMQKFGQFFKVIYPVIIIGLGIWRLLTI